jgi:hypothetical protein
MIDNKYLLLLNQNRREKQVYEFSPIAGGIQVNEWDVLDRFDVRPEKPESHDLRFYIKVLQLDDFRQWFYRREGRETGPFRELHEELVEETGILDILCHDDVAFRYVHTLEDTRQTTRKGMTGQFTYMFLELYDVSFRAPEIALRIKVAPPNTGIILLSESEARAAEPMTAIFDGEQRNVTLNTQYLFAEGNTEAV